MNKYTDLMPDMSEEQYAALKADIKKNGVLEPLLFDQDDQLIDGKHRLKAWMELQQEGADVPMFDKITRQFSSEDAKIEHVLAHNLVRRHLTSDQRMEVAIKLRKPPYSYQIKKIAEMLGASVGAIYNDLTAMTDEEKQLVASAKAVDANGRVYTPTYAPRMYQTGAQQLREIATRQVSNAAAGIAAMGTGEDTPAPSTNGASVVHTVMGEGRSPVGPDNGPAPVAAPKTVQVLQAPMPLAEANKRYSAFAWYGGKASHLSWLLPLLPPSRHFVDVFGGSGAVIMNRAPSVIETYNDLDKELVNFFKVLRDHTEALVRSLALTPFSREERRIAFLRTREAEKYSDLERARMFFIMARQTRSGMAQNQLDSVLNSWKFTRDQTARGMSHVVSQWQTGIDGLAAVASRFWNIQVENYPAVRVINIYDSPSTMFYCDPPYVSESRTTGHDKVYAHEMTTDDHVKLAEALHGIKGRAAVSGYPSELYKALYEDKGWYFIDMPVISNEGFGQQAERVERLWTNYPITDDDRKRAAEALAAEPDEQTDVVDAAPEVQAVG